MLPYAIASNCAVNICGWLLFRCINRKKTFIICWLCQYLKALCAFFHVSIILFYFNQKLGFMLMLGKTSSILTLLQSLQVYCIEPVG